MKASKREKIILGLTVLAALYGGGVLLFSNDGKKNPELNTDGNSANGFVMEIVQIIAQYNLTEVERTVLEKTRIPWTDQSFIAAGTTSDKNQESVDANIAVLHPDEFSFTGYLEIGNRRLAIINGEEYETGEQLTQSSYILRRISPGQVLLEGGDDRLLTVPLVESTLQ